MKQVFINDYVLLFGEYEGVLIEIYVNNEVMVYSPAFNAEEPYVITSVDNITAVDNQSQGIGLPN